MPTPKRGHGGDQVPGRRCRASSGADEHPVPGSRTDDLACRRSTMPHYLIEVAYTPESWGKQVRHPQNRVEQMRPVIEKLGGRLESMYYAFGEYDLVAICQFPDNVSAAALSLAGAAGGA